MWLLRERLDMRPVGGFVGVSPQTVRQAYGHHALEFMTEAETSRCEWADRRIYAEIQRKRA